MHGRDGEPERAVLALHLPDGRRAWGTTEDRPAMDALCREEGVGRPIDMRPDGTVTLG